MSMGPVLIRPLQTEKANHLTEKCNTVVFAVDLGSTKRQIRHAVQQIYKVGVRQVRTAILPGHRKRRGQQSYKKPSWKKAMVQLAKGDSIDFQATL